ncbi:MAG: hypothetical protein MI700_10425, partial [Balneolales bacterium]|nr:hypothetical protein [Balneolales bacterium]
KTVLYDPPRAKKEIDFTSSTVEEVLNCDVLTFHVPLENKDTPYSTYHWLNEEKLTGQRFELIINTARGGVIEEQAVLKAMDRGYVHDIIIDVWENEPDFDPTFMKRAFIATPHIAGYSEQAKLSASRMICDQLCDFFQLPKPTSEAIFPEKKLSLTKQHYSLKEVLLQLHPIKEYHTLLLKLSTHKNKIELFKKLRTDHPFRFEYPSLRLEAAYFDDFSELVKLGIQSQ